MTFKKFFVIIIIIITVLVGIIIFYDNLLANDNQIVEDTPVISKQNNAIAEPDSKEKMGELNYPKDSDEEENQEIQEESPACKNNYEINFIASDNPDEYLGETIISEPLSNWKNYAPLVTQVNELISGLDSDREKAIKIANWVKTSKDYLEEGVSMANAYGTVIDIYNANGGVCLDAAILTVAMLRIADISSRLVFPATGLMHAQTEVYVEGQWFGIDSTFSKYPGYVDLFKNDLLIYTSDYSGYYYRDNNFYEYDEDKFIFSVKTQFKERYGLIKYFYLSEDTLDNWYEGWSNETISFMNPEFYCGLKFKEDSWKPMAAPGFVSKGNSLIDRDKNKIFVSKDGWIKSSLPEGEYMLLCGIHNIFDGYLAYAEFEIYKDKTTIIYPDDLKKVDDANQEEFEILSNLMDIC